MVYGRPGVAFKKPTGRPPKLTPTQKAEWQERLKAGPQACGFSGGCWRTPLIQALIHERFGVTYNVFYRAEFLHHLGFSEQKAKFVAGHLDAVARHRWCTWTWPQIVRRARAAKALLFVAEEASFPPWGSLSFILPLGPGRGATGGANERTAQGLEMLD